MPEPRPDLAAIRERLLHASQFPLSQVSADQYTTDVAALVARVEELEAALASRAPAGEPDELLEAHRRFHEKVGCPGPDDCAVCRLEAGFGWPSVLAAGAAPDGRAPSEVYALEHRNAGVAKIYAYESDAEAEREKWGRSYCVVPYAVDFGATP